MGVPALFVELVKKYPGIISHNPELKIDNLYLDFNCGIHPACYRILEKYPNWKDEKKIEIEMLGEIIRVLDQIITFVNPRKLIYIAIDGPAPVAKMKQQRQRRYKAFSERKEISRIKRKYLDKIPKSWNNSKITPGTSFIARISEEIEKYIKQNLKRFKNIKIILSNATIPSEGEHKIYQHILKLLNKKLRCCIYGLDADLIFLGLASQRSNIYLLREADYMNVHKNENNRLDYFSIDILKDSLFNDIQKRIQLTLNKNNVVNDFIVFCFLLGNDFLPHTLDIRNHGIDIILKAYLKTYQEQKEYLIDNEINWKMFKSMISKLSNTKTNHRKINLNPDLSGLEKELAEFKLAPEVKDPVKFHQEGFRERYYLHYFQTIDPDLINELCYNYLKTIEWNYHYYFAQCISWTHYFPFDHAPLFNDLSQFNDFKFEFKLGKPLPPLTQLTIVLPINSKDLLPSKYQELISGELSDLYPREFEEDFIGKIYRWQGIPKLPNLNIERVVKAISTLQT